MNQSVQWNVIKFVLNFVQLVGLKVFASFSPNRGEMLKTPTWDQH